MQVNPSGFKNYHIKPTSGGAPPPREVYAHSSRHNVPISDVEPVDARGSGINLQPEEITKGVSKPAEAHSADPVVAGVLQGNFYQWKKEDVKGLDICDNQYKLKDGFDDSRDLVAVYAHEGEKSDPYCFRTDFQNLAYGAEGKNVNLYLLLSFSEGTKAQVNLPDNVQGRTERPWNVALAVYDSQNHRSITADGETSPLKKVSFNSSLDAVQFAVDKDVLRKMGWKDGEPIHIQAITTKDFNSQVTDTISTNISADGKRETFPKPWENGGVVSGGVDTTSKIGTAKVAFILHGNQSLVKPSDVKGHISQPDGTGYSRVLDAVERWQIPVEVHLSNTLQSAIEWAEPSFNRRIAENVKKGLVTVEGGVYAEQIMPYFTGEVNQESLKEGKEFAQQLGQKDVPVAWTPERVINSETIKDMAKVGYKMTVADYPERWFPRGSDQYDKIHHVNGMYVMFIDHYFQDHAHSTTDGGMDLFMRGKLLGDALDNDQQKIHLSMQDWEFYGGHPYGVSGPVHEIPAGLETNFAWIKAHPWIEAVTPTQVLKFKWKPVEHGDNVHLPTQSYLGDDTAKHWYYGSPWHDAYADLVTNEKGWDFGNNAIPSGKRLGDINTPGTVIHDTWKAIRESPDNQMKHIAKKAFFAAIFETAWHDSKEVSQWEQAVAGQIRQVTLITASAKWADDVKNGKVGSETKIQQIDLDQDGVLEYVVSNDKVFAAFDRVGGLLKWGVAMDPQNGPVSIVGNLINYPAYDGEAELNKGGWFQRISGFRDQEYENETYSAKIDSNGITFTSPDGKVTKKFTLDGSTIKADYRLDPSLGERKILIGLSPNLDDLLHNGQENLEVTGSLPGRTLIVANNKGGEATVKVDNARLTGTDRSIACTQKVEVTGKNNFSIDLILSTGKLGKA